MSANKTMETLKNIGTYILGLGAFLLMILISIFMIYGAVWVGEHVLQWLIDFSWIAFAVNIFILLPLALFRKTGVVGGMGMFISSYLFGLTLWFLGLLLTYFTWGFLGVFIGLAIAGVGVVPVAMLAMLINAEFALFGILVLITVLTFGTRFLGMFLTSRAEERKSLLDKLKGEVKRYKKDWRHVFDSQNIVCGVTEWTHPVVSYSVWANAYCNDPTAGGFSMSNDVIFWHTGNFESQQKAETFLEKEIEKAAKKLPETKFYLKQNEECKSYYQNGVWQECEDVPNRERCPGCGVSVDDANATICNECGEFIV